jgi:hypothetical protein
MSMMINPAGGGQIIAAGQPFKLRMKKKRPQAAEPAETADGAEAAAEPDEADEDADS